MKSKKSLYLGLILALLISLITWLFYQKSIELKSDAVAEELQLALLAYIEKEEVYPQSLSKIQFEDRGLKVGYEYLEGGRGCRFIIAGKKFELWDEER